MNFFRSPIVQIIITAILQRSVKRRYISCCWHLRIFAFRTKFPLQEACLWQFRLRALRRDSWTSFRAGTSARPSPWNASDRSEEPQIPVQVVRFQTIQPDRAAKK